MATNKKPAKPAEGTSAYTVLLGTLHHDGVVYAPGETVYLEPGDAIALLEAGVVAPAEAK